MKQIINDDGSVQGETFSGKDYKGGYPPIFPHDTYGDFYERCQEYKKKGFHLGDLSWAHYHFYCLGYPGNEECMQDELINP